jgi:putative oxidoreductase
MIERISSYNSVKYVALAWKMLLAFIFLVSGVQKLLYPYDFLSAVCTYEIMGPTYCVFTAAVLPWVELFVGFAILGNIFPYGSLFIALSLTVIFLAAQMSVIIRSLNITCGCFGPTHSGLIGYSTLLRTGCLFLLTVALYLAEI